MYRIGIIGMGAMGSLFYHRLQQIKSGMIQLYPISQTRNKRIPRLSPQITHPNNQMKDFIVFHPEQVKELDLVIILTKAFNIIDLVKDINWNKFLIQDGLAVILSNGYGHDLLMNEHLSQHNRLAVQGTTTIGSMIKDNLVYSELRGNTYLPTNQVNSDRLTRLNLLNDLFNQAGFNSQLVESSRDIILRKVAVNAAINGLTSIWGIPNGKLLEEPYLNLFDNLISEIIYIVEDDSNKQEVLREAIKQVARQTQYNIGSMLTDINAKRRTEADFIFPILIELGKEKNLPCYHLKTLYGLINGLETSYRLIK